jgi:hypothetical protein
MKIGLSRKMRWQLALLVLDTKPDGGIEGIKVRNRVRLALGLTPIQDLMLNKLPFDPSMIDDTVYGFEISTKGAEFLVEKVLPKISNDVQALVLADVIDELTGDGTTKELPTLPEERWPADVSLIDRKLREAVDAAAVAVPKISNDDVFAKLETALQIRDLGQNQPKTPE